MKPTITWILLADSRNAFVLAGRGLNKGLQKLTCMEFTAPEETEHDDKKR